MIPAAGIAPHPPRATCLARLHPAIRLGAALAGAVATLWLDPVTLALAGFALAFLLVRTGLAVSAQAAALRPWLPAALLVLAVHTFTSTEFAPLWHPSRGGLLAGGLALLRVAVTLGWLALYVRASGLEDTILAVEWWLAPLRRLGLPTGHLGLVLAVALGTVPGVMAEGRRAATVMRMRRAGPHTGSRFASRLRDATSDRIRIVVPLVETLVRRSENLTLALRARAPEVPAAIAGPPALQIAALLLAVAALVWWTQAAPTAPGDWGLR